MLDTSISSRSGIYSYSCSVLENSVGSKVARAPGDVFLTELVLPVYMYNTSQMQTQEKEKF